VGLLRKRYGIPDHMKIVGNANFIYPPKWYLGQRVGLKAHEDVIDALGLVVRQRQDVMGVLIGGIFTGSQWYERRLQARAAAVGKGRILMTGYIPPEEIRRLWPDFDVAVHVPTSENCGGVVEPLLAAVPTIAGRVGGLPEVVIDGLTGKLVGIRDPQELARAVLNVLDEQEHYRGLARGGRELVGTMFNVQRTAREVFEIYGHVLDASYPRPREFDSMAYLRDLAGPASSEEMVHRPS
jgi:glycosyltransferase involved in cell wall biosynthesis